MPTRPTSADRDVGSGPLLERADHLAALDALLTSVLQRARGRMVFVGGEAGIGKSTLVRRFSDARAPSIRVLTGACDPLFTPRPLGPLHDIAPVLGGVFQALAERGGRPYEIAAELLHALAPAPPSILLIEDAHWADAATLDVLRFLARRIETVPALILITYRDDLDRTHPLRILLGEIPFGETTSRLRLAPLSERAVAQLAEPKGVDAEDLFRKTAGNPFFVTEALAADESALPPTVRDAVLARIARLPPGAIELLEAVAVVPQQAELWLLEHVAGDILGQLDACLNAGMLTPTDGGVRFRHELARLVIEESLTPLRRKALHRRALHALETPPAGEPDLARLVHHAEAAGDGDAVLRFAPAAAARAAALGAHREAAAHYARALRVAHGLPPAQRGELFERHAHECFLNDQFPAAITAEQDAATNYRLAGDRVRQGDALREVAHYLRCGGQADAGREVALQAVALLEQLPPGRELALAYAQVAMIHMNASDAGGTEAFGQRAYALAQEIGDVEALVHVLNTLGTMEMVLGAPEGLAKVERSLELAHAADLEEHVGRAYLNICGTMTDTRSYANFGYFFKSGLDYCNERGLILWRHYVVAAGARCALDQGRWSEAADVAQQVLRNARAKLPCVPALVVLALIRARRGDPDYWPLLDEALAIAEQSGELQHVGPVSAARAEVAWLEGKLDVVAAETGAAFELAVQHSTPWMLGELACWRWRAGVEEDACLDGVAEPYALELSGQWEAAAQRWERRGCLYEAALARAGTDDEDALRAALTTLQGLGAQGAARIVARRLRERGARALPRGPRPSTRSNGAHLTARELEILKLIVQGLRNADIATRLYLSPKTVEHHISAILAKLGANSRAEAIASAFARGLVSATSAATTSAAPSVSR